MSGEGVEANETMSPRHTCPVPPGHRCVDCEAIDRQQFAVGQRVAVDMPNGQDDSSGLPNIHGAYGHVRTAYVNVNGDWEYVVDIHPGLPMNRFGGAWVALFNGELQAID